MWQWTLNLLDEIWESWHEEGEKGKGLGEFQSRIMFDEDYLPYLWL